MTAPRRGTPSRGTPSRGTPSRRPKHASRAPFAVLVVSLIVGGLGLLLVLNTASAANELRRHDLASKDASLSAQLQQLRNEVAASAAPGVLASAAAALGMVPAGNPAFFKILPDGRVVVMGNPAPASAVPTPAPLTTKPASTAHHTTPAKPTGSATKAGRKPTTAATKSATKTPTKPTPTSTPTPTTTLPGGPR